MILPHDNLAVHFITEYFVQQTKTKEGFKVFSEIILLVGMLAFLSKAKAFRINRKDT